MPFATSFRSGGHILILLVIAIKTKQNNAIIYGLNEAFFSLVQFLFFQRIFAVLSIHPQASVGN